MKLTLNNIPVNIRSLYPLSNISQLQVSWDYNPVSYYTLIVYDIDAPYPSDPSNSPFIHLLATNILGNDISRGDVFLSYLLPDPPKNSQPHRYHYDLYQHTSKIGFMHLTNRLKFPISTFISRNNLQLVDSKIIIVDPMHSNFYLSDTNHSIIKHHHEYIIDNSTLSDHEQRFCDCVLKVANKQPQQCNIDKSWFERRDGSMCYNPYSVCASSVGTTSRNCNSNYDFDTIPHDILVTFANLNDIVIPSNHHDFVDVLKSKYSKR